MQKIQAEKDWSKYLTLHSIVHKANEYTESILNLDIIKQDEYKESNKDKHTVTK